jgi:hypothetical protein
MRGENGAKLGLGTNSVSLRANNGGRRKNKWKKVCFLFCLNHGNIGIDSSQIIKNEEERGSRILQ